MAIDLLPAFYFAEIKGGLGPVVESEFCKDAADMFLNRVFADKQLV